MKSKLFAYASICFGQVKNTIIVASIFLGLLGRPIQASEAYWLDQHNALFYLSTFQLDNQLKEMNKEGAKTLLLHADALPSLISRFIAWRAKEVGNMKSIAWIQKPNKDNLRHAARLVGFNGVQIDDHYFNNPPISLSELRVMLGEKELWCSFQPRQFSHNIADTCDQNDVQIYRNTCKGTGDLAWKMGITGKQHIAVAAYHDGSKQGTELIKCIKQDLKGLGTKLFVFKWKNQEAIIKHLLPQFSK